jgi:hypothetical protein
MSAKAAAPQSGLQILMGADQRMLDVSPLTVQASSTDAQKRLSSCARKILSVTRPAARRELFGELGEQYAAMALRPAADAIAREATEAMSLRLPAGLKSSLAAERAAIRRVESLNACAKLAHLHLRHFRSLQKSADRGLTAHTFELNAQRLLDSVAALLTPQESASLSNAESQALDHLSSLTDLATSALRNGALRGYALRPSARGGQVGRGALQTAAAIKGSLPLLPATHANPAGPTLTGCTRYRYLQGCIGSWWVQGAGIRSGWSGLYITDIFSGANVGVYVDDLVPCSGPPQPVPATSYPSARCVQEWVTYYRNNPPAGLSGSFPIFGGWAPGFGDPPSAAYSGGQALYEYYPYWIGFPAFPVPCGAQGYIIQRHFSDGNPGAYGVPNDGDFIGMWQGALGAPGTAPDGSGSSLSSGPCNASVARPMAWY